MGLLRSLGEHELIVQDSSGLLLPGTVGERLINHYEFYSAFTSDEEFRLVCDGKALGSVPVSRPLTKDQPIIFGGRRWQVRDVDLQAKVIIVAAARGGAPPQFDGLGAMVHDTVREEMRAVLADTTPASLLIAAPMICSTRRGRHLPHWAWVNATPSSRAASVI